MSMYRAVVGCVCLAALTAAALSSEKQGSQGPVPPLDPVRQFEHIGIFTAEKKPDERFVAATKVWVTDFQKHPYRVEWLRSDRPFKGRIPTLRFASRTSRRRPRSPRGSNPVSKPFDAGIARVAFFQTGDERGGRVDGVLRRAGERASGNLQFDHIGLITTERSPTRYSSPRPRSGSPASNRIRTALSGCDSSRTRRSRAQSAKCRMSRSASITSPKRPRD